MALSEAENTEDTIVFTRQLADNSAFERIHTIACCLELYENAVATTRRDLFVVTVPNKDAWRSACCFIPLDRYTDQLAIAIDLRDLSDYDFG
jgi:hypothetical protein